MSLPRFGMRTALVAVIGFSATILPTTHSRAAVQTWTGLTSPNWATGTNWLSTSAPVSGDSLVFDLTTPNNSNTNNINGLTLTGINFAATAAGSYTLGGNGVNLGWQTTGTGITYVGDVTNDSLVAQTVNLPVVIDPAKHVISTAAGSTLNLSKPITFSTNLGSNSSKSKGTSIIFTDGGGGGGINVAGSGLANDATGILGGWATIGNDYAAVEAITNKVVPYAAYLDVATGATIADNANSNLRVTFAGAATNITMAAVGTTRVNSILYSTGGAAQTIDVGATNTLVFGQNGGIYNATLGGGTLRNITIGVAATPGIVTAGDGTAPANINIASIPINTAAGNGATTQINSQITDNGGQPVSVTIRGGYVTLPNVLNSYSGGTYILSGRLSQPTGLTVGTGPIYVFPGGMMNPGAATGNVTVANNLFIAGNGTTENNGLGALRMFQNANGFSTLMTGTVTLMADASVSSNGNTNAARNVGITGKITGPGGLGIGSPVTTNNNGTGIVVIGALTGAGVRNDYAGNTTINGALGGTLAAGIKIGNPDADHILPHGATGSYAGGPTGNMVLNSTVGHNASLELNGSQQTVNGLTNTVTNPSGNIVTNTLAASKSILYVGDSNATATFDGTVTDDFVATGAQLSIVKIGTGTQTLTAVNTYNGDTRVFGGSLSISTPYLALGSDVQISSGGILNLNFAGSNTIDSLYLNGVPKAAGTWGAAGSGALNIDPHFTGTGTLTVSTLGGALLPGDFDGDKDVDAADLAVWQKDFNDNPGADADYDGDSDGNDFLIWQRNLGQTIPAVAASGSVPEPASLTLVALAALGCGAARRKRR